MSKIFEKVVASRLIYYLELNHLGEPLQSAYQRFHNCETTFVRIHNDYVPSITDVVWFCYYSNYRPLLTLSTIIYYSVDSNLSFQFVVKHCSGSYPIFLNVLSLTVCIDLDKSLSPELNCGIPQGSVLSPVLYLLYTSPVADILWHHNMAFHLYADDTQLYTTFSCDDDLGLQFITWVTSKNA